MSKCHANFHILISLESSKPFSKLSCSFNINLLRRISKSNFILYLYLYLYIFFLNFSFFVFSLLLFFFSKFIYLFLCNLFLLFGLGEKTSLESFQFYLATVFLKNFLFKEKYWYFQKLFILHFFSFRYKFTLTN